MATLTVEDIPDELFAALQAAAAAHQRTLREELIHSIELSTRPYASPRRPKSVEEILEEARRIRAEIGPIPISEEILNQAKNEGRP
jgi:plasmid stability protein